MSVFLKVVLFAFCIFKVDGFLTPAQKLYVQKIIQNPGASQEIKNRTKEVIALNYIPWAFSEYNKFVKKNRSYLYKKHIPLNDLRQYAILGMIKALQRYNGSVDFPVYAEKYVFGTLHQGVTDLIPLRPISHSMRMNKQIAPPIMFAHEHTWLFDKLRKPKETDFQKILRTEDKYICKKEEIEKINKIVKQETPYKQRMFYYRYCEDTLKEIRTIGTVANLMSCSTETYRKKMKEIMEKIRERIGEE